MTPARGEAPRGHRQGPSLSTAALLSSIPLARPSMANLLVGFLGWIAHTQGAPSPAAVGAEARLENEFSAWAYPIPVQHGVDLEAPALEEELDQTRVDLMHRRVHPPGRFDYRVPHEVLDPEQEVAEDMNNGFTST